MTSQGTNNAPDFDIGTRYSPNSRSSHSNEAYERKKRKLDSLLSSSGAKVSNETATFNKLSRLLSPPATEEVVSYRYRDVYEKLEKLDKQAGNVGATDAPNVAAEVVYKERVKGKEKEKEKEKKKKNEGHRIISMSSSDRQVHTKRTEKNSKDTRAGAKIAAGNLVTPDQSDTDKGTSESLRLLAIPYITNFQQNAELNKKYRQYLRQEGAGAFLRKFLKEALTKEDLVNLILHLGYPKETVMDYPLLSVQELSQLLVQLILTDPVITKGSTDYSLSDFLTDLQTKSKILIITGAGISTSLGLPDFRSHHGLYHQLKKLSLTDPREVFNYSTFLANPQIFYSIAHLILPPENKLSLLHLFLKVLQDKNKMQRLYTQNIDNLETRAGITKDKLVQCHGSFAQATCLTCGRVIDGRDIFQHILLQQVPRCYQCWESVEEEAMNYGIIKPNITFFGEDLPKEFDEKIPEDLNTCDLIIIIGTSLKVDPVGSIIDKAPPHVKKVLINKEQIPDRGFDLSLIGYCDDVASYLISLLGKEWHIDHPDVRDGEAFKVAARVGSTIKISRESTQ
ncbi:hypothetical protein KGF56_003447 [Candida oxycetoniae]|uniref:Deacetylase sirtuin-type domain-containing protein n=1 Tax=Candida oxycetoniae TaxID=497107 RepID=A0AAI9SVP6_9ASCO|nr:uncharacterized protein KGF56_003447 [Candida oxycetoniae]KAI3403724.2 hypothetical protein KGF56_003447 [Candida oxycetoniae]